MHKTVYKKANENREIIEKKKYNYEKEINYKS